MKKIGIVTIIGKINFGNRLQNYALQETINKLGDYDVETIINFPPSNHKKISLVNLLKLIKLATFDYYKENNKKRRFLFNEFDNNIKFASKKFFFNIGKFDYDILVVGSDQVWNPSYRLSSFDLCDFNNNNANRISYAASLGINTIPNNVNKQYISQELNKFSFISVREEKGKELLEKICNHEIKVVIDPTMLLDSSDWQKMAAKPEKFNDEKYILNYFLGKLSKERQNEIKRIAEKYNCKIINILDKNDKLYESGPAEFLYLVKNAFLICTDSFHSSVFSFIFDKSFVVFEREQKNIGNMNSRIDTLLNTFNLKNRVYNGKKITNENINHDYSESFKLLEIEKSKCKLLLKSALEGDEE